ncbi:MAG TPA: response regulator [Armatimonadetes bacterium]|nr:response regulator [Armatimonadota bacterium]
MPIRVLIADPTTEGREELRRLLGRDPDIEVVAEARDGNEVKELVEAQNIDVVIADLSIPGVDAIKLAEELSTRAPPFVGVIIVSGVADIDLMRRAMLAGAGDFLVKPVSPEELKSSVKRVFERLSKQRETLTTAAVEEGPAKESKVITVYSPQGGSGKTIIAANLAVAMALEGARVVLVDLNLQFGDVDLVLNLVPERTLAALVPRLNQLDSELMEQFLTEHETGLKVLAAPSRPEYAETITAQVVEQVVNVLRQNYSFIIIDTPSELSDITLAAIDQADVVLLVTTLDLLSLHNTRTVLETLQQLNFPFEKIRLVLNRADSKVGITPEDVENTLDLPVSVHIPSDGKVVVTSVNNGEPFVISNPEAPISQVIRKLARELMGKEVSEGEMARERRPQGFLEALRRFLLGPT